MMLLSQSIGSILVASSFLFSGALGEGEENKQEIIGYRTVHVDEATEINKDNKPYRDEKYDYHPRYAPQLGHGFYMTNEPASWPADSDEWYCAIKADSEAVEKVGKVWIPKHRQQVRNSLAIWPIQLWYADEEDIQEYVEGLVPKDPEKALRFSYIHGVPELLQMVIPTKTINNDELDFWAQCWETEDELLAFSSEIVPWTTKWQIAGNSGPAVEEDTPVSQILAGMSLGQEE
ncbi:hypothetical protein LZ554_007282 [Drepanopeziza brunnea f. sp. 'monogermtubi']|nr:hypothetical protein LZ554_007282 [Drepanopeziza brunnea f. sp. 'monogermtubi']